MSLSEIEIRTPYVVAERLIVALMLRFKPAKNVLSDTLVWCPLISLEDTGHRDGYHLRRVSYGPREAGFSGQDLVASLITKFDLEPNSGECRIRHARLRVLLQVVHQGTPDRIAFVEVAPVVRPALMREENGRSTIVSGQ
jgi:hypothetical protein